MGIIYTVIPYSPHLQKTYEHGIVMIAQWNGRVDQGSLFSNNPKWDQNLVTGWWKHSSTMVRADLGDLVMVVIH